MKSGVYRKSMTEIEKRGGRTNDVKVVTCLSLWKMNGGSFRLYATQHSTAMKNKTKMFRYRKEKEKYQLSLSSSLFFSAMSCRSVGILN